MSLQENGYGRWGFCGVGSFLHGLREEEEGAQCKEKGSVDDEVVSFAPAKERDKYSFISSDSYLSALFVTLRSNKFVDGCQNGPFKPFSSKSSAWTPSFKDSLSHSSHDMQMLFSVTVPSFCDDIV